MRVVACLEDPLVIKKILEHLARSGSATAGVVWRGAYAVSDKVNVGFSYFINTFDQDVGTEQDYDRLQLDLNVAY